MRIQDWRVYKCSEDDVFCKKTTTTTTTMAARITLVSLQYICNTPAEYRFIPVKSVKRNSLHKICTVLEKKNFPSSICSFCSNVSLATLTSSLHTHYIGNKSKYFQFSPLIIVRGVDYPISIPSIETHTHTHTRAVAEQHGFHLHQRLTHHQHCIRQIPLRTSGDQWRRCTPLHREVTLPLYRY